MTIRIKPAEGARLVLPEGGTTLDGAPLVPGTNCPRDGAVVENSAYIQRRLWQGDAERLPDPPPDTKPAAKPAPGQTPSPTPSQGNAP